MMDIRPRWTIQKNPPRFPRDRKQPWVVFETAAGVHGTAVMSRFASCAAAKSWAKAQAPDDTEVVIVKKLKRSCSVCGQPL
jgi:hypothetical protein